MARARLRGGFRAGFIAVAAMGVALAVERPSRADGDDLALAQSLLAELERDAAQKPAVAEVTSNARAETAAAIERGRRMRFVGDETHARAAEGLAREWAETGRDIARAVAAEAAAATMRRKAVESQAQLERTRALLEEGIAHVGRLRAELEKGQVPDKAPKTAVEVHDGTLAAPLKGPNKTTKAGANTPAETGAKP